MHIFVIANLGAHRCASGVRELRSGVHQGSFKIPLVHMKPLHRAYKRDCHAPRFGKRFEKRLGKRFGKRLGKRFEKRFGKWFEKRLGKRFGKWFGKRFEKRFGKRFGSGLRRGVRNDREKV